MVYVDGFLSAVPTANKVAYLRHAENAARVFRDHGALSVVECWGDDMPAGKLNSMSMAVQCREDEIVVFSWVTWPDKATRDACLMDVFSDPRMRPDENPTPYDGKRLIRGGFEVVVRA